MRSSLICIVAWMFAALFFVSASFAGVTVHYQGKAKDAAAVEQTLTAARYAATRYGWEVKDANVTNTSVSRNSGGKEKTYKGPLTGIVIYAHPMCEPVHIQFGNDLLMQDYVKTQFAGPDIHVKLIDLLRKLKPTLADLQVFDEGEYWEAGDRAKLEAQIATVNKMIEAIRKSHPNAKGPFKLGNGRIVDLTQ